VTISRRIRCVAMMRNVRVHNIRGTPEEKGPLEISRYWRIILPLEISKLDYVRSEILTLVVMKSSIFWDITPYIPFESQRTFQRNMSSPSSGSKNKPRKKQREVGSNQSLTTWRYMFGNTALGLCKFASR
jgi:hypothetical protein